jgi:hypothetical protein
VEFDFAYRGDSTVTDSGKDTAMSFSPDLTRPPTFFRGELRDKLPFREAMSALHDVVVSDLRHKPKDRSAYLAWRAQQEQVDWALIGREKSAIAAKVTGLQSELDELTRRHRERSSGYNKARDAFFKYTYERERDTWFVLDPVVSVQPDQLSFECFSLDESSYGRLAASHEVFAQLGERALGTTNVDYSQRLYDEFQKIRSYKGTQLEIDPGGFAVATRGEAAHKEVKIDLPDSWVRGFLQVSSAMGLPATSFELHPMDVHNLCFVLRRRREVLGPRSLRFCLSPDRPVRVIFEPWGTEIVCPRSIYRGAAASEIRVWGRRRLHVLERLVPVARKVTVHLLGSGMPSFWVADLGDLSFTLGLSGWTANDWSTQGNLFAGAAPRGRRDHARARLHRAQGPLAGHRRRAGRRARPRARRGGERARRLGAGRPGHLRPGSPGVPGARAGPRSPAGRQAALHQRSRAAGAGDPARRQGGLRRRGARPARPRAVPQQHVHARADPRRRRTHPGRDLHLQPLPAEAPA